MSSPPNKRRKLDQALDLSSCCDRCRTIPWSAMIQKLANRKYYCVAEVSESQQDLALSSCRICQSLAILKSDKSQIFLHALSAGWLFKGLRATRLSELKLTDTVLLRLDSRKEKKETKIDKVMGSLIAVEPTEPTSEPSPSLLPSQPWPRTIEYERIKSWITYCNKNHDDTCTSKEKIQLQPFKVIDCISHQSGKPIKPVSLPTNQEYAALSYVWGEDDKKQSGVSESTAPVINDSIEVTKRLGYKYLWVDRHCIDQKQSENSKKKEFEMMDKIYSQASFTIIAAAGKDSGDGLAGVTAPRNQQRKPLQIDNMQFRYLGKPPRDKIQSTKWAERGWTYQEGFLSRRRIFFTNEQVVFQCNNMTCLESLSISMEALHNKSGRVLDYIQPLKIKSPDTSRKTIGDHIIGYSAKQLTKKEDSLNAFLGILSYYEEKYFWGHFLGNPIHDKEPHMINAWYHLKPATRVRKFPTWSWTGWRGELKLTSRNNPEYKLELVTLIGEIINIDKYRKRRIFKRPKLKPFIQLTGMVIHVPFEFIDWGNHKENWTQGLQKGIWAALRLTDNITAYSLFYPDHESLAEKKDFSLPAMILESGTSSKEKNTIILVLQEGKGYYQRAGLMRMASVTSPEAKDSGQENDLQPTMYKDASGCWSRHAPTCEMKKWVWLQAAEDRTFQVW
ncbi:heterokaryon incompatibility protein-domain-containing protein [Fusarium venenatum]|uniref:heterokaryon incompatibility protein-domain-containing protein n=1 Tax=Fusarium venenatum TaxID=56646 RepID=UPI001DA3D8F1|nr:heterokaryon incompatibility protein-domain-containing protein [Fusarium venenatum]